MKTTSLKFQILTYSSSLFFFFSLLLYSACSLFPSNVSLELFAAHYPEGPWVKDDDLYYVEYSNHRVVKNGKIFYEHPGCGPASLISLDETHFLVSCYDLNSILVISTESRNQGKLVATLSHPKLLGPNDFAKFGDSILVTASGPFELDKPNQGTLFELNLRKPLQKNSLRPIFSKLNYPNGVAAVDEAIFISEHFSNCLAVLKKSPKGEWLKSNTFKLPEASGASSYRGPDGLKYDQLNKQLVVAHYGTGNIHFLNLAGNLEKSVSLPFMFPTNIFVTQTHLYVTAFKEETAPYTGAVFKVRRQ